MNELEAFHASTRFQWEATRHSPFLERLVAGAFAKEQIAMLTLQMFHYVKYTVRIFTYALGRVPPGEEHEPLRKMLRFFADDEAGHELVALQDLERMGYDRDKCKATLPLPTALNLHGANRLAVEEYGPYYLVGETYATETAGAELSGIIARAYAETAKVGFYTLHAEADQVHALKSEEILRHALSLEGTRRPILLGYLTALRNLHGLAEEAVHASAYPSEFQLPLLSSF